MDTEWKIGESNMFNNSNFTDEPVVFESIVPPSLQYGFGVFGNLIAIILLFRSSGQHKWKPFYRLVGGLAITDFCGIALVYPAVMIRYISGFTFDFPKELCGFVSFCFSFSFLSSALIVSAMSFDRFLAVTCPILYRESQVRMLINASASDPKNGPDELLAVRMTISNAIVDPWIYIILRKENLVKMSKLFQRVRNSDHLPTIFITRESKATRACGVSNPSTPPTCSTQL
ncbi:prostaglandin E2 receptor EP4 subtype-like [Crassostrea angulata]|uniref:prostaglandin E2 receptor EP4 subtype-like n=1 Tax=Magallana angulata TaxID=2784310 RepID=UPI0022B17378|nr:prostaglandin E2 receptor EP4 subtype-like [Crassostrea angulata]